MRVQILRVDADLAQAVPAAERQEAVATLRVGAHDLPPGPWSAPPLDRPISHTLGLLVLEGYLMREVELAQGRSAEVLGPGDVLRPWDDRTARGPIPVTATWVALTSARVAMLDRPFLDATCKWPGLGVAIASRLTARLRAQSALLAISHLPRLEPRLVALLWHLADRHGHVERQGVVMPLPLTHDAIGRLVGARRPSVTRSMRRLVAKGALAPRSGGGWLLKVEADEALRAGGNHGYPLDSAAPARGTAAST